VRIELVTGTTDELIGRLTRHDVEAAFVSEPFHAAAGIAAHPAFKEELVLITAPRIRSLDSLVHSGSMTLIAFGGGCSYRRLLEQWQSEQGAGVAGVLEFASYPAIVACVAAGTGVAIVPRSVLAGLRAAQSVRVHELPARFTHNRTHLIWHEGQESLALRSFRRLLPP
jgi:DNA-binding transcriptional LysR family regulator